MRSVILLIVALGVSSGVRGQLSDADQGAEALEEAQREGQLDALGDLIPDHAPLDSLVAPPPDDSASDGFLEIHRASLRWTGRPSRLRLKLSATLRASPIELRPHLLAQRDNAQGAPQGAQGDLGRQQIRASLEVGPLRVGHQEMSWGEGMTVGLGERDPHWAGRLRSPGSPLLIKPWPWLGPVHPPVSLAGDVKLPHDLRTGSFWIRSPYPAQATSDAYGGWIVREFGVRTSEQRSRIGALLLHTRQSRAPNLSLAGCWIRESGWVSGEIVGDGRLRGGSMTAVWSRPAGFPSLRRIALRLRWEGEGPWIWSHDPRRPPSGRARLFQIRTGWSPRRGVGVVLEAVSETRWSDARPVPSRREGLVADLSLNVLKPIRPKFRFVHRRSREPRWTEGMGRHVTEETSRLTMSLRIISTHETAVSLRGGLSRVALAGDSVAESPLGSAFWEWHGRWKRSPWAIRWTLGGGSGEGRAGRWLGLFPDPTGWVLLPAVAPSLWIGAGVEGGWGGGKMGLSGRAQIRDGRLRTTWVAALGWRGSP
jgi:hypothetical protein